MACRGFVEGRGNYLAAHGALHVGHFLRTFVDQQNDQIDFGVIFRNGVRYALQHHRLTGARRRHDQPALTLAHR